MRHVNINKHKHRLVSLLLNTVIIMLFSVLIITSYFILVNKSYAAASTQSTVSDTKVSDSKASDSAIVMLEQQGISVNRLGNQLLIIIPSQLLFADGGATVRMTSSGRQLITQLAAMLRPLLTVRVNIQAYVPGKEQSQQALVFSAKQAELVAHDLWQQQPDTRLISTQGMGAGHPVSMRQNSALNARVVLTLTDYSA